MFTKEDIYGVRDTILKGIRNKEYDKPDIYYGKIEELNHNTVSYGPTMKNYNNVSIFGKRVNDASGQVDRLIKEIEKNIKDTNERIKVLGRTTNGAKYEVELRNGITTLLNTKLSAIKAKIDFASKADKAIKEDYKLSLEATGGVVGAGNQVGDTNSFMSSLLNLEENNTPNYNFNVRNVTPMRPYIQNSNLQSQYSDTVATTPDEFKAMGNNIEPSVKPEPPRSLDLHVQPQTPTEQPTEDTPILTQGETIQQIDDMTVDTETGEVLETEPGTEEPSLEEMMEESVEQPHIQHTSGVEYTTNALNEPIAVFGEDYELEEFVPADTRRNMEKAFNNIIVSENENVVEYFKYNKEEGIGYLVKVDETTNKEIPGVDTLPIELLYPWHLDLVNHVVSTHIRNDYPILYTEEPTPEHIKNLFYDIKARYDEIAEME